MMNAVVNESRENLAEFRAPGPGERLKAARVSLGLEPSKIAAQLHLSTDMVHAIERDDYSAMPARVFVRGYIKNYARVVGLPPDSLLKQLDEQFPDEGDKNRLNRVGTDIRREVRSSHGVVRLMTWLIVLGLAVLFVLWWRGHLDWRLQTNAAAVAPETTAAPTSSVADGEGMLTLPGVYPGESMGSSDAPPVVVGIPQAGQPLPVEPPVPETKPPSAAAGSAASPPAAAVPGATDEADANPLLPASDDQAFADRTGAAATVAARETRAGSAAAPAPRPGPESSGGAAVDDVLVSFSAPCWVDIRDSSGGFKLYGKMTEGREEVLGGRPPYRLIIGNAQAASIRVGDKPVDLAPHTRGNVARLTLNPDTY